MDYNYNSLPNNVKTAFTSSWLYDKRFEKEPGYILCHKLRKEMDESPNHEITLESAVEFLNFYGFDGMFKYICGKDAWMHCLALSAIRQLDGAMIDGNYKFALINEEATP